MASTIWKGHLTFGLISIPIKLFRAARAEKVHMHHIQRTTGARVRQALVAVQEGPAVFEQPAPAENRVEQMGPSLVAAKANARGDDAPSIVTEKSSAPKTEQIPNYKEIPRSELVRGFEYEKDRHVELDREELDKLAPKTSTEMEIVEFVRFQEVDPVYLESSYYVAADRGGDKSYALLYEALKKTGQAAIAEFVMHRRDQTMILRPGPNGIIAHTLFYEDEVKRGNEFHADSGLVQAKELDLAVKLVDALATKFEPEKFKDKYRERLEAAISEKVQTGVVRDVTERVKQAPPAPDIMSTLKESLARAKKPVASEGRTPASVKEKAKKVRGR